MATLLFLYVCVRWVGVGWGMGEEEDVEPVLNGFFNQGNKQKDLKVVFICKKRYEKGAVHPVT